MQDDYNYLEKRQYKRLRLKFQVEIENLQNHQILSLISRDISVGGMGISKLAPEGMEIFTEEELETDAPIGIRLILPGSDGELVLKGIVKWAERTKTGIWKAGIEFDEPQVDINKYYIKPNFVEGKRKGERYNRLFQIEVKKQGSNKIYVGISTNLSSDGMQIFSDQLYPTDTPVEVRMHIMGTNKIISIKGKILWARQEEGSTWRMGVAFDETLPLEDYKNL
jgi:hypothetical protein